MEIQFDSIPVAYLQKLTCQLRSQEQTLEVRLPDGMPDVGQVLGAWGQVIVRGKEWNGDDMAVSCGVMVWVLYTPEESEDVHSVEAWLPFSMKWDLPDTRRDGKILVSSLLKSVDARVTSARKLLVRATLEALGEAWLPAQAQVFVPGELPADVQLLTETYPVELPRETGEKAFLLEEQLSLPANCPKAGKLLYYCLQPEILDQKVMAGKVVFRGNGNLHLLYRAEDCRLCTADFDLPFSQYADLEGEYDGESAVSVQICVTSLDLELDENGELQLKAGILGQYLMWDRTMVTVTEDAYSPQRPVSLVTEQLLLPAMLDRREQSIPVRQTQQTDIRQMVDIAFYPAYGSSEHTDSGMSFTVPGQFQMLYYAPEGDLCSSMIPWEGEWQLPADRTCSVDSRVFPMGRPQAIPGAGVVTLQAELGADAVTTCRQGMTMITGLDVGETEKPDPNRPGLILCRKGNRRLWDVAKQTGTTVERILQANRLEAEPDADQILLIPVS